MKNILFALGFLLLVSCEKKSEPTTYSFTNKYSEPIYSFFTFTDVDDSTTDILDAVNHGNLDISESTDIITTDADTVFALYSFDSTNYAEMVLYVTEDGFKMEKNTHNEFIVNNYTYIYGGTTYHVYNTSNEAIYEVESYYLHGSSHRDIKNHLTIESGARSLHIRTDKPNICVEYEITGKDGRFVKTFTIISDEINRLNIDQQDIDYVRNNLKSINKN